MTRSLGVLPVALILVLATGCDKNAAKRPSQSPPTKAGPVAKAPPGAVHGAGSTGGAPASGAGGGLSGTVVETMDSGGYSYVKLKTPAGEKWAAIKQTKLTVGQQVTVTGGMEMKAFKSRTLNRVFPSITFGSLGTSGATPNPHGAGVGKTAAKAEVARPHSKLGRKKATLARPIPRAAGANGYTVAELFAKKAGLKDKVVAVRGMVVKVNRGILGRNWIHIQDGSGAEASSNFDLTVTSKEVAEAGKVVQITGTVRLNKDFGAGYLYPVLVDDARITP